MEVDVDLRAQSSRFIVRILAKQGVENPGCERSQLGNPPQFCVLVHTGQWGTIHP